MAVVLLIVLPLLQIVDTQIIHQTLLGNFPQRIRWMAHRYLLRQSMSYFQDEFAGRIGAKLMQTALAVREVVMKILDVTVFVVVYFAGAVVLAAMSDLWLAVPFLVWLVGYVALLWFFIPRLGKVSESAGRCALADDRPHRRQLHQHRDGEAVLAFQPRGSLCPRGHGRVHGHRAPADAACSRCCRSSSPR